MFVGGLCVVFVGGLCVGGLVGGVRVYGWWGVVWGYVLVSGWWALSRCGVLGWVSLKHMVSLRADLMTSAGTCQSFQRKLLGSALRREPVRLSFWNQRVKERLMAVRATQAELASKSVKGI